MLRNGGTLCSPDGTERNPGRESRTFTPHSALLHAGYASLASLVPSLHRVRSRHGICSASRMLSISDERSRNARASFGSSAVRRSWSWFFLRTAGSFSASRRLLRMVSAWLCWMRDVAALALVAVEHVVADLAAQDPDQLVGQVERVVDAGVHAHGADRRVHVRGIAGEDRAPERNFVRDPLVHGVDVAAARSRSPCRSAGSLAACACSTSGRRSPLRSRPPRSGSARASGRAAPSSGTGSTIRRDRRCSCARCSRAGGSRRRPRCSACGRNR